MLSLIKFQELHVGIISLDQEKAFDRVDHRCIFKTLKAFSFGPYFISRIKILNTDVYSMLKINGALYGE